MNWSIFFQAVYVIIVVLVILRVLYDTRSSTKALAYILLILFAPVVGMVFYFSFGINYRKRKMYSKKLIQDDAFVKDLCDRLVDYSRRIKKTAGIYDRHKNLINFISRATESPLTANNNAQLLINGEQKFPELLREIEKATHHIHFEYYIYEGDQTGTAIAEALMTKARQGVEVRFLYDDYGSHSLSKSFLKKLTDAGVQALPFYKIKLYALANHLNYRNHRKIVIIDGKTAFVGGINISDKYRNDLSDENTFWRDTHLKLKGPAASYLQYLFMCDWNFCAPEALTYKSSYFPVSDIDNTIAPEFVQLVPSGPDSDVPGIFYSLLEAISTAKTQILITSPYFIPGESLMDALIIAAESGVDVQLLVPGKSDSGLVDAAARSYYTELLKHGVDILLYKKGFVHAKTMVIDERLAIVGSANMDYRSFDLNFEINACVYGGEIPAQLKRVFDQDRQEASHIKAEDWLNRPKRVHLWEKIVRLLSPFL